MFDTLKDVNRVAFIGNAKDMYEDKSGLEKWRDFFRSRGKELDDVDLRDFNAESILEKLTQYDLMYFAGGNAFVLLEAIKESGLDAVLGKILAAGVIYLGQSAGSVVMGKSIYYLTEMDDPSFAKKLTDYSGLGYVDCVIVPHADNPKYAGAVEAIRRMHSGKVNLKFLDEKEYIVIE